MPLPFPDWERIEGDEVDLQAEVRAGKVTINGAVKLSYVKDAEMERALTREISVEMAQTAAGLTFVHAGVLACPGGAVLLPGSSYAGKSTLVRALLTLGLQFYSDEYAVIDAEGLVHSFPRPLQKRLEGNREEHTEAVSLGWRKEFRPLPVRLVVFTRYQAGTDFQPVALTAGEGVLQAMLHTVSAQLQPARDLAHLSRALAPARMFQGPRGDVEEAAARVFALCEKGRLE